MAELIEVTVQLQAEDYTRYNHEWFLLRLREWLKRYRFGIAFYGIAALFLIALLFILGAPQDAIVLPTHWTKENTEFSVFLAIFLAIILWFVRYYINNIRTVARRFFDSNKMMQAERRYQFGHKGFEIQSENGHVTVGWDKVNRIVAFPEEYAIFIATTQSYLIPKRCFSDTAQEKAFCELVSTYFTGGIG